MADLLRTRLAQGRQTLPFPGTAVEFPARFRGRLSSDCSGCGTTPCPTSGRVIDAATCLFSPEEAIGEPGCGAAFSHDYRLASNTREGLASPSGEIALATALDAQMRRLFARSLRLRSVAAGSCGGCEAELTALGNVVFDMARFGIQFVASPRHADGIVITGSVNENMRDALVQTYAAVAEPKIVIAVGACAVSGGPFSASAAAGCGVASLVPVDLWIAGCPPHPLSLLDGLLRLLGRIEHAATPPVASRAEE